VNRSPSVHIRTNSTGSVRIICFYIAYIAKGSYNAYEIDFVSEGIQRKL
jgi:hypothetical protein